MASVTVKNSIITKNSADIGGGLLNSSGTFNVENSLITGNRANSFGGGVYTWSGEFSIQSSSISMNSASEGGGVSTRLATLLTIKNSKISNNRAGFSGGGMESSEGNVTIDQSTISKNRSGSRGAGIALFSGPIIITNSTISGNVARDLGGGWWNQGTSQISNSTISGNTATKGGGVYTASQLSFERNLISGNKAKTGQDIFNFGAGQGGGGTVVADDFNLVGTSNNSGIFGFNLGATDIVPSVPVGSILAPLADNGGPTPTHALVTGSPAVDAVPGAHPECSGTDQRDVPRPQGVGCDIGAFEK